MTIIEKLGAEEREVRAAGREIAFRTRGTTRGPITRLVSPSDLGEVMKPFVFLDLAHFDARAPWIPLQHLWHPHSGIATVTVMYEGTTRIADTTGADVLLPAGGVEWMRAGGGVWHTGEVAAGTLRGFQLWVALPPELENAASESRYVMPDEVPAVGPARVILGSYGGATSVIDAPPMTYLQVDLKAGERWVYEPAPEHDVTWLAVGDGVLRGALCIDEGEVVVFAPGDEPIELVAERDARFVIGSAPTHRHALHLGSYSVHTSRDALERGEREIRRIGRALLAGGTLRRSPILLEER